MSFRQKSSATKMSDDEAVSERDYLTSVLNVVNGYCKINFVIPQINSFNKNNSLLPINAKVDVTVLNNTIHKSQLNMTPDTLVNMLKNSVDLKDDDSFENLDDKQFQLSNNSSADDFQIYCDNSDIIEKKEDKKRTVSPRGKKKKNKYNKVDPLDNSPLVPSTNLSINSNTSKDYMQLFDNERVSDGGFVSLQEQVKYFF